MIFKMCVCVNGRVSPTKNAYPSAYLQDVVAFLTTVVRTALQNLPQNIKTFVYFDALDHLATSLKVPGQGNRR